MMRKWIVRHNGERITSPLITGLGRLGEIALAARGITDDIKAREFFEADNFHDPFLMKDMDKAVELIKNRLACGDKITVYGDYDCDGVTSTVMLYGYLTALGGEADWLIPSREEGYGLNAEAVRKMADSGTKLIITVDNGVSAVKEAALIKNLGMELIITDHHNPPGVLPEANAIVNPKQPGCEYPFKELAGCGVVLKLIAALEGGDTAGAVEQYGDLAAIGTIADIVTLGGENRHIVSLGLESIEFSENIGLFCLLKQAGLNKNSVDSISAAFLICPRINAAGRLEHASKAVELLTTENEELAAAKAQSLSMLNASRMEKEKAILCDIEERLKKDPAPLKDRVLVLSGEGWHHGIIGIVASRMLRKYGKPCVIITYDGDGEVLARGSCRSFPGFSVYEMLSYCSGVTAKFGGHAGAGGFSLPKDNIEKLENLVQEYAAKFHETMPRPEIIADGIPEPSDITFENSEKLEALQPFGEGNPEPLFCLPDCIIKHKRPLKEGKYTAFEVNYGGREFKILDFNRSYADFWYVLGDRVDLMVTIGINEYNDTADLSIKAADIRLSAIKQDRFFAAADTYERINRGETVDNKLLARIIPDGADFKKGYDIIKESFCLEQAAGRASQKGINYCKFRVILDIFAELGLAGYVPATGNINIVKTGEKADLSKSEILKRLKNIGQET